MVTLKETKINLRALSQETLVACVSTSGTRTSRYIYAALRRATFTDAQRLITNNIWTRTKATQARFTSWPGHRFLRTAFCRVQVTGQLDYGRRIGHIHALLLIPQRYVNAFDIN